MGRERGRRPLIGRLTSDGIDEYLTHGPRRGPEKMSASVPIMCCTAANEMQVELVGQGCCLKGSGRDARG